MSVIGPTTPQPLGGGSSFSNAGQQTRGLSAADWTRLQRLRGARTSGYGATGDLVTNVDIAPTEASYQPYNVSLLNPYPAAGTHKTLRPSSKWTDYIASQTADFVTQTRNINNSTTLSVTKVCSCVTTTLNTKTGNCQICRFKTLSPIPPQTVPYSGPNGVRNMLRTWL